MSVTLNHLRYLLKAVRQCDELEEVNNLIDSACHIVEKHAEEVPGDVLVEYAEAVCDLTSATNNTFDSAKVEIINTTSQPIFF